MRVGQWPRVPLHRTPSSISRAFRQKHRSPEPDCPRRSSLPGIPETASLGPDQSPQRSASSDPSANGVGIIPRESNNQMRFHTVTDNSVQSENPTGLTVHAQRSIVDVDAILAKGKELLQKRSISNVRQFGVDG